MQIEALTKKCGCCGKLWVGVPVEAQVTSLGYWWDCTCKSTMFLPINKVVAHAQANQTHRFNEYQDFLNKKKKEA